MVLPMLCCTAFYACFERLVTLLPYQLRSRQVAPPKEDDEDAKSDGAD